MATAQLKQIGDKTKAYVDSIEGAQLWDKEFTGTLPSNPAPMFEAQRIVPMVTFSKHREFNPTPFIQNPHFDHVGDFRPDNLSIAEWRRLGIARLTNMQMRDGEDLGSLPANQQYEQITENGILGPYRWFDFFFTPIHKLVEYWVRMPKRKKGSKVSFNIEESLHLYWDMFNRPGREYVPNMPNWADVKDRKYVMFLNKEEMSLEELHNRGWWDFEIQLRAACLWGIVIQEFQIEGASVAWGGALWHTQPETNAIGRGDFFRKDLGMRYSNINYIDGAYKVTYNETGGKQTITFEGPGYTRTYDASEGSPWKHQKYNQNYRYWTDLSRDDKKNGMQGTYVKAKDYKDVWADLHTRHPFASEVGEKEITDSIMKMLYGKLIPSDRQYQLYGESEFWQPVEWTGTGEKVDPSPMMVFTELSSAEFFWSNVKSDSINSGTFGFDNFITKPGQLRGLMPMDDLKNHPRWNKLWHAYEAVFAAGATFQGRHDFLAYSTLTSEIDYMLQGSGQWAQYKGVDAYGFQQGGGQLPMKPCVAARYLPEEAGLRILFGIGHEQRFNDKRSDTFRIPDVMGLNKIRVTYAGEGVRWFEVFIPKGLSNTTFEAKAIIPQYDVPGYEGILAKFA
ncbi:hypothetical protein [Spirosoma validum]|uniref:Uncharacterized protein n=1 Tax=Spirosoma validum TaxID=2771355 RepID=A0A927B1S5_9BACT|nr:hypothetical protein [Spirosoma validum]MBD2753794.1 hypothetical protein [Spirosoma validum]